MAAQVVQTYCGCWYGGRRQSCPAVMTACFLPIPTSSGSRHHTWKATWKYFEGLHWGAATPACGAVGTRELVRPKVHRLQHHCRVDTQDQCTKKDTPQLLSITDSNTISSIRPSYLVLPYWIPLADEPFNTARYLTWWHWPRVARLFLPTWTIERSICPTLVSCHVTTRSLLE